MQKAKFHQVDEELIKEYFPATHVIKETMAIYQELFGLEFSQVKDAHVWHEDVLLYEVRDKQEDIVLGHFYLDLYPRDGKYNHYAVFPLVKRVDLPGKKEMAAAAMVGNFEKPSADKPSLMYHDNVVVFFHEFGHLTHELCTKANYSRFSGTETERDFVELPSQMLENWVWSEQILGRLTSHYKTGESMPEELIQKKLAIKNLNEASRLSRLIFLGIFDLLVHTAFDKSLLAVKVSDTDNFSIDKLR